MKKDKYGIEIKVGDWVQLIFMTGMEFSGEHSGKIFTVKEIKTKEEALHHLLRAHSILFENYENSSSNQYILSSISQIADMLQPNSNEKELEI